MDKLKKYNLELRELTDELFTYIELEKRIRKDIDTLEKQYQRGDFGYEKYSQFKEKILSSVGEIESLSSYINTLLDKIEYINTQVFLTIYEDNGVDYLQLHKPVLPILKNIEDKVEDKKIENIVTKIDAISQSKSIDNKEFNLEKPKTLIESTNIKLEESTIKKGSEINKPKIPSIDKHSTTDKSKSSTAIEKDQTLDSDKKDKVKSKSKSLFFAKFKTSIKKFIHYLITDPKKEKNNVNLSKNSIPNSQESKESELDRMLTQAKKGDKLTIKPLELKATRVPLKKELEETFEKFSPKQKKPAESDVKLDGIINTNLLKRLFLNIKKKDSYLSSKTKKTHSLMELKDLIEDNTQSIKIESTDFLTKEAGQLRKLMDQKSVKIYNPTSIGFLANFLVRKLSLYLIENYPDFFKNFYLVLRKANIKVLSNTYINIMLLVSFIMTGAVVFFTLLLSTIQKNPFTLIFAKVFVMSIISFIGTAGAFYYYPVMKVSERLKSINTNLPFAIDQMASVVSSGVPPATMFKLIAKTKEYGEVSVEIEKISNLIEVFGYDLVSSMRSVTTTTPSKTLKEFFEGLISTIETGGSLKNYLTQKSKEALLAYQTERQKYVENISTYSDIYTGLLIAAPLFFVSTLSLVSLLGGKVGNMEVSTLISLGTYLIIPVLNILFIVFLELNQPQV